MASTAGVEPEVTKQRMPPGASEVRRFDRNAHEPPSFLSDQSKTSTGKHNGQEHAFLLNPR